MVKFELASPALLYYVAFILDSETKTCYRKYVTIGLITDLSITVLHRLLCCFGGRQLCIAVN